MDFLVLAQEEIHFWIVIGRKPATERPEAARGAAHYRSEPGNRAKARDRAAGGCEGRGSFARKRIEKKESGGEHGR